MTAYSLDDYLLSLKPTPEDEQQAKRAAMMNASMALLAGRPDRYANIAAAMYAGQNAYGGTLQAARQGRATDLQQAYKLKQAKEAEDARLREQGYGKATAGKSGESAYAAAAEQARRMGDWASVERFEKLAQAARGKKHVVAGALVTDEGEEVYRAPKELKAPEGMQYVDGVLQEIPGYVAMRSKIAAAGRAPVQPEQVRPQMIDTPEGPVWAYPPGKQPAAGGPSTVPVTGPSGAPIGAKPVKQEQPTEGERTAAGYGLRMRRAEELLDKASVADQRPGLIEQSFLGKASPDIADLSRSPERQMARQAQEDWVRAKLRKESGAVIAAEEMDREIRTYFPQIFERDPKVIEQKAAARKTAMEAMDIGAGRAQQNRESGTIPPSAAVEFLRNNPAMKTLFDQKYGKGAAARVLGQ